MKLNYINISLISKIYFLKDVEYTINELKEIWPKIDIYQFNHISIQKFRESNNPDFELDDD